ncbi:PilW family protein [Legionella sp. CNM-4043-24]|uniref:PilW family protein n=1 Tax=Legionella sp. CNM-4043-24 TaxID=3421646 RepID=UPI00403A8B4A
MIKPAAAGYSIIEFMIAISLGAMLVAGVATVYLSNKSTYVVQEGLARLQENGRYANYLLSREIRMAGYQGCTNQKQVTIVNQVNNPSSMVNFTNPLFGYDGTTGFSPALPSNISAKSPVAGSDVIEIRRGSEVSVDLNADMASASAPVSVYPVSGISSGRAALITNCVLADIFIPGSNSNSGSISHASGSNISGSLSLSYPRQSSVMSFIYYAFYIKDTGRVNSSNAPIRALVRLDINGNEDEIAEGVEQMQVLYGVDTNGDNTADTYQTAAQVNAANNWSNVISLQINLLLSTTENVNNRSVSYTFNGATTTPTDRRLRREWNTFITLRNRGLPS